MIQVSHSDLEDNPKETDSAKRMGSFRTSGLIIPHDIKKNSTEYKTTGTTATSASIVSASIPDTPYNSVAVCYWNEGGTVTVPTTCRWDGKGFQLVGSVGSGTGVSMSAWFAPKIPGGTGDLYISKSAQAGLFGAVMFQITGVDWEDPFVNYYVGTSLSPGTFDTIPGGILIDFVMGQTGGDPDYGIPPAGFTSITDGTNIIGAWKYSTGTSETSTWTGISNLVRRVSFSLRPALKMVLPAAAIR